ncbi:MAG: hypothetical protein GY906_03440 [bacterium]|nr:hypothetical protein [bacterium]
MSGIQVWERSAGVRSRLSRWLAISCLVLPSFACVSGGVWQVSERYYGEGPESALASVDPEEVRTQDQHLIEMERAIALLELGRYEESYDALYQLSQGDSSESGTAGDAVASMVINDAAADYELEYFEQVYLHTMAAVNALALQNVEIAAHELDLGLGLAESQPCEHCRYTFTRYLGAIVGEELGYHDEAQAIIDDSVMERPNHAWLRKEAARLRGAPPDSDNRAARLESRGGKRVLYVLLLLGRGPVKIEQGVYVPPTHGVAWPEYVNRGPDTVVAAQIQINDRKPDVSVELNRVLDLAQASLSARKTGLIVKESAKTAAQEVVAAQVEEESSYGLGWLVRSLFAAADRADLRHWASLPASCQVLRVELPDDILSCQLEYRGPAGQIIDQEVLDLPQEWAEGSLFVTRRMP